MKIILLIYLFIMASLLGNQLIKDGAVILINLLHLIDVTSHLLHGFQSLCGDKNRTKCKQGSILGCTCGYIALQQQILLAHCVYALCMKKHSHLFD